MLDLVAEQILLSYGPVTDTIGRITTNVTPWIFSTAPASGAPGTEITISGRNLLHATQVAFNGTPAVIVSDTATSLVTVVPAFESIRLTTGESASTSASNRLRCDWRRLQERSPPRVLDRGSPCEAVIVQSQPLGVKSSVSGLDMYAFMLTIMAPGQAPYQVQVGNPVPPEGIPLVFPGSRLPAMYLPGGIPENVVINWKAALASF